ncbi:MAG: translational GTPase TypA [Gemmatimonadetes bacterium]|nr:translational GTPase TypA [Gemmatimonadota bacterium]
MIEFVRNIAIIAHVDHGKTTLVDRLLQESGILGERAERPDRLMDSNDLERERGITILAKNTAIEWNEHFINIVDTPGHADFGGEVERILSMVDSVLLLVDAVDGPMPQTRFVTQKAFAHGLRPIVIVNKVDRDGARPDWVVEQTFDLFDRLGATEEQLDFPVVYTSATEGWATLDPAVRTENMNILFETIREHCPHPPVDLDGPLRLQVTSLDYSSYLGAIGVGRVARGTLAKNSPVVVVDREGGTRKEKVLQVFGFQGVERVEKDLVRAGEIVAFTGIENPRISDTLCDPEHVEALPALTVDEPTIRMSFEVNTSPFAGLEGKFVTSRQIRDRLYRETVHNVALVVEDTEDSDRFMVSGRGELHLSILLENLRREGFEIAVSRPRVIRKMIDGKEHEPYEALTVDIEERHQGALMETLGARGGRMENLMPDDTGRVRLEYIIPTRGLIGFQTMFRTLTNGTGLLHHVFDHYGPSRPEQIGRRTNGVLVSMMQGKAAAFALFNLQERGRLFTDPGDEIYEGQIVGIHSRENDLAVNPIKGKKLTNMRASGKDDSIVLTPAIRNSLEEALEFLDDDELVEVTPKSIRLRKRLLKEVDRMRSKPKPA